MSNCIGVIRGRLTGRIFAVINPDEDSQLDNDPNHLIFGQGEPLEMVRLLRGKYTKTMTLDQVAKLVEQLSS